MIIIFFWSSWQYKFSNVLFKTSHDRILLPILLIFGSSLIPTGNLVKMMLKWWCRVLLFLCYHRTRSPSTGLPPSTLPTSQLLLDYLHQIFPKNNLHSDISSCLFLFFDPFPTVLGKWIRQYMCICRTLTFGSKETVLHTDHQMNT